MARRSARPWLAVTGLLGRQIVISVWPPVPCREDAGPRRAGASRSRIPRVSGDEGPGVGRDERLGRRPALEDVSSFPSGHRRSDHARLRYARPRPCREPHRTAGGLRPLPLFLHELRGEPGRSLGGKRLQSTRLPAHEALSPQSAGCPRQPEATVSPLRFTWRLTVSSRPPAAFSPSTGGASRRLPRCSR